jgi:hypothetical protein
MTKQALLNALFPQLGEKKARERLMLLEECDTRLGIPVGTLRDLSPNAMRHAAYLVGSGMLERLATSSTESLGSWSTERMRRGRRLLDGGVEALPASFITNKPASVSVLRGFVLRYKTTAGGRAVLRAWMNGEE